MKQRCDDSFLHAILSCRIFPPASGEEELVKIGIWEARWEYLLVCTGRLLDSTLQYSMEWASNLRTKRLRVNPLCDVMIPLQPPKKITWPLFD